MSRGYYSGLVHLLPQVAWWSLDPSLVRTQVCAILCLFRLAHACPWSTRLIFRILKNRPYRESNLVPPVLQWDALPIVPLVRSASVSKPSLYPMDPSEEYAYIGKLEVRKSARPRSSDGNRKPTKIEWHDETIGWHDSTAEPNQGLRIFLNKLRSKIKFSFIISQNNRKQIKTSKNQNPTLLDSKNHV